MHDFPQIHQVLARCCEGEEVWEGLVHNARDAEKVYDKIFTFWEDVMIWFTDLVPLDFRSTGHHSNAISQSCKSTSRLILA